MRNVISFVVSLVFFACQGRILASPPVVTVGKLANPACLVISGNKAFSTKQIADALFDDPEFLLAARSNGPLSKYTEAIRQTIRAGYCHAGYADVTVAVDSPSPSDTIAVHVKEGPRYQAGKIRITGAKTVPSTELIGLLTNPHWPKEAVAPLVTERHGEAEAYWVDKGGKTVRQDDAVWTEGEPARFLTAPEADTRLHVDVADALAELGYYFARFSLEIVPDRTALTADLVIHLDDEGPRSLLDDVEIEGNRWNTREQILEYIAWKPGVCATREEQGRIKTRLWRSGRFVEASLKLDRPARRGEKLRLKITLAELDGVPTLSQPLSPTQDALLKMRDWLARPSNWAGDLVYTGEDSQASFRAVISPAGGVYLDSTFQEGNGRVPREYAVLLAANEAGVYCLSERTKFTWHTGGTTIRGYVSCGLDKTDLAADGLPRSKLTFSFGLDSSTDAETPFDLCLSLAPVSFLRMASRPGGDCYVHKGVLTLSGSDLTIRADARSGKPLELVAHKSDSSSPGGPAAQGHEKSVEGSGEGRIQFVRGEFDRRAAELRASTAQYPNSFDSRAPLTSALRTVATDRAAWKAIKLSEDDRVQQVVLRLLDKGVLKPLDDVVVRHTVSTDSQPKFRVSELTADVRGRIGDPLEEMAITGLALLYCSYPRESWPAVLASDGAFAMFGCRDLVLRDLHERSDLGENSPLSLLGKSEVLDYLSAAAARETATRGLERLSLDDFRKEYPVIFDPQSSVGQTARQLIAAVRELDDRDAQALASLLPETARGVYRSWRQSDRNNRGSSVDQSLGALLDAAWQSGLQACVKARLQGIQARAADKIAHASDGAETLRLQGAALHRDGKLAPAIARYSSAIAADPEISLAYCLRGFAHAEKDAGKAAEADFRQALKLDPKCWQAQDGLEGARIIAWVGAEPILSSELFDEIDALIEAWHKDLRPEEFERHRGQLAIEIKSGLKHVRDSSPEQVDRYCVELVRQLLGQKIGWRKIYQEFRRTVSVDYRQTAEASVDRYFQESQLKTLLQREQAANEEELDAKLHARGTSLERERRVFREHVVSEAWIVQRFNASAVVSDPAAHAWYRTHIKQYDRPSRARWEELRVPFSAYPSRAEARAAAEKSRAQALKEKTLTATAKHLEETTLARTRDWTSQGALVSEEIDRNLFKLPIGQVSPVIEGPEAFHLIRVIERTAAGPAPFDEVRDEIRKKLHAERMEVQRQQYNAQSKKNWPIATIFGPDFDTMRSPRQAITSTSEQQAANIGADPSTSQSLSQRALAAEANGDLVGANILCTEALRQNPTSSDLLDLRARLYRKNGPAADMSKPLLLEPAAPSPRSAPAKPDGSKDLPGWKSFSDLPEYPIDAAPQSKGTSANLPGRKPFFDIPAFASPPDR